LRNFLIVTGMDEHGRTLAAVRQDADSWGTPGAATYIGEVRQAVYPDTSLMTQADVDAVADAIWAEVDKVSRYFHWQAQFDVTLFPGDVVEIEDEGRVKLTEISSSVERGFAVADYTGEWLGT
jgi:hypothetical protein